MQHHARSFIVFYRIGLLVMLLTFVAALGPYGHQFVTLHFFSYDLKRLWVMAIMVMALAYTLCFSRQRKDTLITYQKMSRFAHGLLCAILALGLLASYFSALPEKALLEVALYVVSFFFIVIVATWIRTAGDAANKKMIGLITLLVAVYLCRFFYGSIFSLLQGEPLDNGYPGFVNVRFLSQVQAWLLPLMSLSVLWLEGTSLLRRIMLRLLLILWWSLVFLNLSIALTLSVFLGYAFVMIVYQRSAMAWLRIQGKILGLAFLFYAGSVVLINTLFVPMMPDRHSMIRFMEHHVLAMSFQQRWAYWGVAWRMLKTHPWLGVGPMHFAYYPALMAAHPHNTLLLIGSEWGVPALLLWAALFLMAFFAWLKRFNAKTLIVQSKSQKALPIALTAALVSALCYSMLSGVFVTPLSQLCLCVVIGWMLGLYQAEKGPATQEGSSQPRAVQQMLWACVGFLACAVLAYGVLPGMTQLSSREVSWVIQHHNDKHTFYPRFWIQGKL